MDDRNSKKGKRKRTKRTESHCEQTAFENRVSTHLVESGTLEPGINREQKGFWRTKANLRLITTPK